MTCTQGGAERAGSGSKILGMSGHIPGKLAAEIFDSRPDSLALGRKLIKNRNLMTKSANVRVQRPASGILKTEDFARSLL